MLPHDIRYYLILYQKYYFGILIYMYNRNILMTPFNFNKCVMKIPYTENMHILVLKLLGSYIYMSVIFN